MEEPIGSQQIEQIARLAATFDVLGRGDTALSQILGYCNPTVIHKVRRGLSFISPVRLSKLAELDFEPGYTPNLHWILTGAGDSILGPADKQRAALMKLLEEYAVEVAENFAGERDGSAVTDRRRSAMQAKQLERAIDRSEKRGR